MSKSISMTITKRVSTTSKAISMTIQTMSISSIKSISICLWFSLSLTLGNVYNTSRVSNISTSTGIGTMDGGNSSRSNTMDTYSVGNIGNTITNSMVYWSSIGNMSNTISMVTSISQMTGISKMSYTISKMSSISIGTIESICFWFSLSLTLGNMNSTSRVGSISTSTGIGTMDGGNSSRSNTMDTYSVGNIGDTITNSMVYRSSIGNMSNTISMVTSISQMTGISKMSYTISKMSSISIRTIESICFWFSL